MWSAMASSVIAMIALGSLVFTAVYTNKANQRSEELFKISESLFVAQNIPLVDVTPISITQSQNANGSYFATTTFNVANYSGFHAYNIRIDLKYGTIVWIGEWVKAYEKIQSNITGQDIDIDKPYESLPKVAIPELGAWKMIQQDVKSRQEGGTMGSLLLKGDVCAKGDEGLTVLVRVAW